MILIILFKQLVGYVTTGDLVGLQKYHAGLQEDCQKVNNLTILSPEVINNPRSL